MVHRSVLASGGNGVFQLSYGFCRQEWNPIPHTRNVRLLLPSISLSKEIRNKNKTENIFGVLIAAKTAASTVVLATRQWFGCRHAGRDRKPHLTTRWIMELFSISLILAIWAQSNNAGEQHFNSIDELSPETRRIIFLMEYLLIVLPSLASQHL